MTAIQLTTEPTHELPGVGVKGFSSGIRSRKGGGWLEFVV